MKKLISLVLVAPLVVGCVSNSSSKVPQWVLNPTSPNGMAASGCGPMAGDFSMARDMAVALARRSLAQQMQTRVKAVDKVYGETNGIASSQTFQRSAELVTDQVLSNTKASRVEQVEIDGKSQMCAMMVLGQPELKTAFRSIVKATQLTISQEDEKNLYSAFSDF